MFEPWRSKALCASLTEAEKEWFFASAETSNLYIQQLRKAQHICLDECPVQIECLTWAIENREPEGVWGGLTNGQRKRVILRKNSLSPSQWPKLLKEATNNVRQQLKKPGT